MPAQKRKRIQKQRPKAQPEARRPKDLGSGQITYRNNNKTILTHCVGAMPIINHFLERMRLREFLDKHLPRDDSRTHIDSSRVVLLLLKNLLVSREPVYSIAEWTQNFAPDLFDLWPDQIEHLNDDRIGRCLDRVTQSLDSNLIMDVVTHVVLEFDLDLSELHNDSTTISVFGDYSDAAEEQSLGGQTIPAITWGHSKDHRPDLKQLLYILTISDDGGVPIYFQAGSGNTTDDQTHQATWRLMAELVQRPDFVYVADCKLATTENMNEIARLGGRFITVLPATRKEDTLFRRRLAEEADGNNHRVTLQWQEIDRLYHEDGKLRDVFRVCTEKQCGEQLSKEGYRVLWFYSWGKAESDASTRIRRLHRAIRELTDLRQRLSSPRTRFRNRAKVNKAVDAILDKHRAHEFLHVSINEQEHERFRQTTRGRPTENTKYRREVETRYGLTWETDTLRLEQALAGDGVFPLITNITDWTPLDVLQAYKRQPTIEKRFSQLKTDFRVAPIYLKSVRRIVGLLAVYFFALMVQALIERELRLAMQSNDIESLPLYAEGRPCFRPTARRVLDVFEPISRHTLTVADNNEIEIFTTELALIHRQILKLLKVSPLQYRE